MKIKPEHFAVLKTELTAVLDKYPDVHLEYEQGDFDNADKTKDLQRRFCFDILYGAGLNKFVCDELYPYLNDDHIYTALKSICPKVTKRY